MKRLEAVERILVLKKETDAISVVTMSALPLWHKLGGAERLHIDVAAMSLASSVGLGIALAQPEKKVIVIDGDGSLLMELGVLASIAGAKPYNFHLFVLDNGHYDSSGCQSIPGIFKWGNLITSFDNWGYLLDIPSSLMLDGPWLYDVMVESEQPDIWPPLDFKGQITKFKDDLV